jgi:V/A-type H+-transporting ATPase subunit E
VSSSRHSRRDTPLQVSAGVEDLITRLRDQGVAAGQAEADRLVQEARDKASALLQDAETQARAVLQKAHSEADALRQAGQEALELAFRDTVIALRSELSRRFAGEVQRLVREEEQRQELLERMVLEVVGRVRPTVEQSAQVEVLLPGQVMGLEELSRNPEELENGTLTRFVRLMSQKMLRDGVEFGKAGDNATGLRLRLVDRDIVLDLSDKAVADVILAHLQPRFRALLEGVVK